MHRVVKALDLQKSYIAVGRFKSSYVYKPTPFQLDIFELKDSTGGFRSKITFVNEKQFRFDKEKGVFTFGQVFENSHGVFRITSNYTVRPGSEYMIGWQPAVNIASSLAGSINVQPKGVGTGMLTISMETATPAMGTDIVNELMNEYRLRSVEIKSVTASKTLEFIDDRLDKLGKELDSIAKLKLQYQQKHDLIDVDAQSSNYFEALSTTDASINLLQEKSSMADMLENYLKDKRNEHEPFRLVPSALGLEDVTLNQLVQGYNLAQLERKSLLEGGTPVNNPIVRQQEAQIEEMRKSLLENLINIRGAISSQLTAAKNKNDLAQRQIKQLPEKTRNLLEIDIFLEGKQNLYKFLTEKREETAISKASNIPDSDVLDSALVPGVPIKPNRKIIQLLAIVIGLGLPALYIFTMEVLNDKITTRYDIEKITKASILGEVGHSASGDNTSLVVGSSNRSMVAEQFRIIRSNLQYVLGKSETPVILVTSSFSGEGKSFVSTNLSAVMALAGLKTIVLEFDIRKPKIMAGLKLQKKAGITNFLLGKATMEELPVLVPGYENLFVLPCGPVPPNPSELLLENKVTELFAYLKKHFDAVIIDTAPVGMVSDAMTLSKFADCTLYIVRQGHTFKKQIILIDEFYEQSRLPKISIVINDVKLKPGYGYYGYGRYGYGYGYGQGYYEEDNSTPKNLVDKIVDLLDPRNIWKRIKGNNN
jgi:capsular exopolysaccharide synthesis family protein